MTPPDFLTHSRKQRLDSLLDGRQVSANNLSNFLTTLEKHDGRHSAHTELLAHIRDLVHVDLVELDIGVDVAPLLDLWRNGLAGATPFAVAVEDGGSFSVEDDLKELGFAVDV